MAEIRIENLKYRYPHTKKLALDGITCEIKQGEFIGVIGRNGSGKSTFCQALTGLVPNFYRGAYGGKVFIDNIKVDTIFEIVPQMVDTMSTIMDAQKSRGMETEGNLLVRMKAFVPLISPVVMSSLVNTKDRAMALEIRGFNARNKKTFLNEEKKSKADGIIKIVLLSSIVIAVGWRVSLWLK